MRPGYAPVMWRILWASAALRTLFSTRSGGSRYNPTTSRTLATNNGSLDSFLDELGDALAGLGLLFVILRALVDGGEELREVGPGLLAFRAEVRPVEDAPEPQHGLQNVVVVDAEVIDPALGDEDRVLPKVGHPGAGHGETYGLVADRVHGGVRRDF